jgi:hypothetical protein
MVIITLSASLVAGDEVPAEVLRRISEREGRGEIRALRLSAYPQAESYYLCDIFSFAMSWKLFTKMEFTTQNFEIGLPEDARQGDIDLLGERIHWVKMPFLIKQGRCQQERKEGGLDCSLTTVLQKTELGYELDVAFILSENLGNGVTNFRCSVASQQTLQLGQLMPVGGSSQSVETDEP